MKPIAQASKFGISFADLKALTKVRLSLSVVFSSLAGYLLGAGVFSWGVLGLIAVGGYAMVGASNAFNQVIERDLDAKMKRTANRPIPSGRVSPSAGLLVGMCLGGFGLVALYFINVKTAAFGAFSMFIYTMVYTPLKVKTPLAVFAGAFPGAIPFMLGWVAATNHFGIEAGALFVIQFFWQFPHFWAIAWLLDDDYKRAGFKMLPNGKKDSGSALQIMFYIFWTMMAAMVPVYGFTGRLRLSGGAAILITCLGLALLYGGWRLYKTQTNRAARSLVLGGIVYITLVQAIYVLDKYFILES